MGIVFSVRALRARDFYRSHTGTGKTLAFCLPLTEKMLQISEPSLDPICIVLSPTRYVLVLGLGMAAVWPRL